MRRFLLCFATLLASAFSACAAMQSALEPAGAQAERIDRLLWFFALILGIVYVVVVLLVVLLIPRLRERREAPITPSPRGEKLRNGIVGTAVGVTVLLLFVFLISDFAAGRSMHSLVSPDALTIKITGRQWWWEVQYQDSQPSKILTTANEIHLPIGKPVKFELRSADVIHSFWIPNLHGKKDLIPGHPTIVWYRADRAGEFRGQCAEFCGAQHAHMRFTVVTEPQDKFQAWLEAQRQSSVQPTNDNQKRGQHLFVTGTCAMCHTISGTDARGTVGPNLTHIASRPMIAAGSRTNTVHHLSQWIQDPHAIKPGVKMPQHHFSPQDLAALTEYLESLK